MQEFEKLQSQLDAKFEEYDELSDLLTKRMVDPYRQYEDLQLGNESLKPILIKPDIKGVDYHELVDAEIRVGLEGVLSAIRDFVVKIVKWIRDRIVAAYKWLINANDEIHREIENIRKNTVSEKHNELVRLVDKINTLEGKINNEFVKLIHGHTLEDGILLSKVPGISNKLLENVAIDLPDLSDVNVVVAYKEDIVEEFDSFVNNSISGNIDYSIYIAECTELFIRHGQFKQTSGAPRYKNESKYEVDGEAAITIDIDSVLTTRKLKSFPEVSYLAISNRSNTITKHELKENRTDIGKLTLGDILKFKDLKFDIKTKGKIPDKIDPDDFKLEFNINDIDVDPKGIKDEVTKKDIKNLNDSLVNAHNNLLGAQHKKYREIVGALDSIIATQTTKCLNAVEATVTIIEIVEKEYDKTLALAKKILVAIEQQKG